MQENKTLFNTQTQLLLGEGFYDLWLATLILAFSSSLILIHNYLKSRKTPIGRAALYTALSSIAWSVAVSVYTFPEVQKVEFTLGFAFLGLGFIAGTITLMSAYERAKIQSILTPSGKAVHNSNILLVLSILILPITALGVLATAINNHLLNIAMGNLSILTVICLVLISISLISPYTDKIPKKIPKIFAAILIVLGTIILVGYFAINYNSPLDSFLPGGQTTIETAKGFLFAGIGIALFPKHGLKAWVAKIVMSMSILFIVVSDLVAEFLFHPLFLANSAAACFVIVAIVQLWSTLKTK